MRTVGLLLLAIGLAAPAAALAAAKPISKIEARALPPAATKQRVMAQLSDILTESARPTGGRRPVRPMSDLWYATAVRSTDYRGLCAFDKVAISFRPSGGRARGADTPVRADGVSARTGYRFIRPPEGIDEGQRVGPKDYAACAKLKPDKVAFFEAPDQGFALSGGVVFDAVLRGVRAPAVTLPFTLVCDGMSAAECRKLLAAYSVDGLNALERCDSIDSLGQCWRFEADGRKGLYQISVYGSPDGVNLSKVKVDQLLIVADERID